MKPRFIGNRGRPGVRYWIFDLGPGRMVFHYGHFSHGRHRAIRYANELGVCEILVKEVP